GIWGYQSSLVALATVLTVFLREQGASARMVGFLAAVESGGLFLPQVLGLYIFASRTRRKRDLMAWHFAVVIPFLFVAGGFCFLGPHMTAPLLRWSVLTAHACFSIAIGVVIAVWTDWLAHIFPLRLRGIAMGSSMGLAALCGMGGSLTAGWAIRTFESPHVYGWLYVAAGGVAWVAMVFFCFIVDPMANGGEAFVRPKTRELIPHFIASLRERNFRRLVIGRMLTMPGFAGVPFITMYYTSSAGGGIAPGVVVSCGAAMTGCAAASNLALGLLGDRRGHRIGMRFGAAAQVAALVVVLLTRGEIGCVLAYAGVGLCFGSCWVSYYNMLFETCPHGNRAAHITAGNLLVGAAGLAAALVAGPLAGAFGLRVLFALILAASAAAFLWFLFAVEEPRRGDVSVAAPR
ncbi:MAG TPA: hypothetical protein VM492_01700, partial [Sumerlaeia bacterium]|nr:hypothetical protein [Sumerlaeia bacterium]